MQTEILPPPTCTPGIAEFRQVTQPDRSWKGKNLGLYNMNCLDRWHLYLFMGHSVTQTQWVTSKCTVLCCQTQVVSGHEDSLCSQSWWTVTQTAVDSKLRRSAVGTRCSSLLAPLTACFLHFFLPCSDSRDPSPTLLFSGPPFHSGPFRNYCFSIC